MGAIILLIFASSLAAIALHIQSAEYSALVLLAMTCVVVFAGSNARQLLITCYWINVGDSGHGPDGRSPAYLGLLELSDGILFVLWLWRPLHWRRSPRFGEPQVSAAHSRCATFIPWHWLGGCSRCRRSSVLGFIVGLFRAPAPRWPVSLPTT